MTDFCRGPIDSSPQFPVQNYSPADSRTQRDADDRVAAATCTLPHLADGGCVGVILENRRPLEFTG